MAVMEYYEAYDRELVQTQGIADVTTMVPAQDWATRFTELQGMLLLMFPPWALALITKIVNIQRLLTFISDLFKCSMHTRERNLEHKSISNRKPSQTLV